MKVADPYTNAYEVVKKYIDRLQLKAIAGELSTWERTALIRVAEEVLACPGARAKLGLPETALQEAIRKDRECSSGR